MNYDEAAYALREVQRQVQAIRAPFEAADQTPPTLYHYTTLPAVLGILESKSLWCSEVRCMNDPTDGTYARELTLKAIEKRLPQALAAVRETFDRIERYISSFSANGDLLQQWREYCLDGRGVAVGMRTSALQQHSNLALGRVCYETVRQHDIVNAVIDAYTGIFLEWDSPRSAVVEKLAIDLYMLTIYYKTPAYSVEEEYRVHYIPSESFTLGVPKNEIRFRTKDTFPVPYVVVNLADKERGGTESPFVELIVGPCLEWEPTQIALQLLLERERLLDVQLSRSAVPMRLPRSQPA